MRSVSVILVPMLLIPWLAMQDTATSQNNAVDEASRAAVELGSRTAKNGFRNEDEIQRKLDTWKTDEDAQGWLSSMGYLPTEIENIRTIRPHGEKADLEVEIRMGPRVRLERISIKLVSGEHGFNQIDKRWLRKYAGKWRIPADVETSLKRFVGELPAKPQGRSSERMFLNELDPDSQASVVRFFSEHRERIISDLFAGEGDHAADWMLITHMSHGSDDPGAAPGAARNVAWRVYPMSEVQRFFGTGDVLITRSGNLKIGRITMQRKGGDNGRESARMLQFKINPSELFNRPINERLVE